jgi:DNA-binding CsgD family transcriptional regulator
LTHDMTNVKLTDAEIRVLDALRGGGGSNKALGQRLGCSARTVEAHLASVSKKTGIKGRTDLAVWWRSADPAGKLAA